MRVTLAAHKTKPVRTEPLGARARVSDNTLVTLCQTREDGATTRCPDARARVRDGTETKPLGARAHVRGSVTART